MQAQSENEEKTLGKDRYFSLLGVITANTGGEHLPVALRKSAISQTYCYSHDPSAFKAAMRMALDRGDIVEIPRPNEREPHYAVTVEAVEMAHHTYNYTKNDREAIREIVVREAESENTRKEVIQWGNRHINQINSGDSI